MFSVIGSIHLTDFCYTCSTMDFLFFFSARRSLFQPLTTAQSSSSSFTTTHIEMSHTTPKSLSKSNQFARVSNSLSLQLPLSSSLLLPTLYLSSSSLFLSSLSSAATPTPSILLLFEWHEHKLEHSWHKLFSVSQSPPSVFENPS